METIFRWVYELLMWLSGVCHTTYNTVNVVVYYLLVPLSWTIMVDCIIKSPCLTPVLLVVWIVLILIHWRGFQRWCDVVFRKSVAFLLSFQRIGWNYTVSSVIICVVIPLLIYLTLFICLGICK